MLLSVKSFIGEPLGLGRKSEDPVRTRGFEVLGGVQEDVTRAERERERAELEGDGQAPSGERVQWKKLRPKP